MAGLVTTDQTLTRGWLRLVGYPAGAVLPIMMAVRLSLAIQGGGGPGRQPLCMIGGWLPHPLPSILRTPISRS
jgi:hypothetical protein